MMFRSLAAGLLAAAALTASGASPAQAALISTGACDTSSLSQPFRAWGDSNFYKLVPGGDFEGSLSGWTVRGASVVTGGGPLSNGAGHAVALDAGDSVQTPKTCVNTSYPTFRFFSSGSGNATSTVLVEAVYALPLAGDVAVPVGTVTLSPGWSPTLPMLTASTVTGVLSNGTAHVALRFTQVLGSSRIDDVYIDPRMR